MEIHIILYLFFVKIYSPGSRDLTNRHFKEYLFHFNTLRGLWIVSKYGHSGLVSYYRYYMYTCMGYVKGANMFSVAFYCTTRFENVFLV